MREGRFLRVEFHAGSVPVSLHARLADEALAAADAAWPVLEKLLKIRTAKVGTIHLHGSEGAFRAQQQIKHAAGFDVEGFTLQDGLESHVLLWPQLSPRLLEAVGLPAPTRQNLILAAARQVAAQQIDAAHQDPWLVELIAYAVLEAIVNPKHAPGVDVGYDTRRALIVGHSGPVEPPSLWKFALFPTPQSRQEHDVLAGQVAVVAQHLAASDANWARKMLGVMRGRKGGWHITMWRGEAREAVLGGEEQRCEERFARFCRGLRPVWWEVMPLFARQGNRWLVAGCETRSAALVVVALPPKGDYAIRATVEIDREGQARDLRVQLDWSEQDLIAVFFEPGRTVLARWDVAGASWSELAQGKAAIERGKPFAAAVEVTKETLRVTIDGVEALAWPCKDRGMHGAWGIASGDMLAWLENLRCEPLAPVKK